MRSASLFRGKISTKSCGMASETVRSNEGYDLDVKMIAQARFDDQILRRGCVGGTYDDLGISPRHRLLS
jgi:hypothetical protein